MKHLKKVSALVLAVLMMMAVSVTAFAAEITRADGVTGKASITVTLPTVSEGSTATNTYKIYKVFDATNDGASENIAYTLVDGKTTAPTGFTVDAAGNVSHAGDAEELTADEIKAIAAYVTDADVVATVTTTVADKNFTVTNLPYGYYYITTTTGTVVTVNSTNPTASVNDKNTVPEVDKKITNANSVDENGKKALAQVGTNVTYTATVKVGKGAENYVFHDTMGESLSYNNDVKVQIDGTDVEAGKYTNTATEGDTITISFDNDYIGTLAEGTEITITYSAKVTSDALTVDPVKNTAYVSYGDENGTNSTPKSETEAYNAKFTVTKKDGEGAPLADAGFVIQNADGKYYKIVDKVVSWVASIDDATEYKSDADGAVTPFTGLANGTYTLVEKTVPAGYNKAADSTFTVAEHVYTKENLEQASTVENKAGTELPSTGGIGTTMFYVIGGVLMAGAAVVLVARKKMS